jgi:uncharacterized protein YbjT (DUF2867 family)
MYHGTQGSSFLHLQGTGTLGRVILSKLLGAKEFDIRVISRQGSSSTIPTGAEAVQVDYDSQASLVSAIRGFDTVINVVSTMATKGHFAILDAVLEAQIPRYYPADFGSRPPAEGRAVQLLKMMPPLDVSRTIHDRIQNAVLEGKLTYTSLRGGAWIETVLQLPLMYSIAERKFFMHNYPDVEFSFASKDVYATALLNVLRLPDEETKNRCYEVELFRVSQQRTLELLREALPDVSFEVVSVDIEVRFGKAMEAMRSGTMSPEVHAGIMSKICLDPDAAPLPGRNDNKTVGVKHATDEDFKGLLIKYQS